MNDALASAGIQLRRVRGPHKGKGIGRILGQDNMQRIGRGRNLQLSFRLGIAPRIFQHKL